MIKFLRKRMTAGFFLGCLLMTAWGGSVQASIYTIFSDKGKDPNTDLFTWPNPPTTIVWLGTQTLAGVPEGTQAMVTQATSFAGWGIFYRPSIDLSNYDVNHGGVLRFWLYTDTDNLLLTLEHTSFPPSGDINTDCSNGRKDCWDFRGSIPSSLYNQWIIVQVPMFWCDSYDVNGNCTAGVHPVVMNDLYSPFEFTANQPATVKIDNVRYVDNEIYPTSPNQNLISPRLNATIKTVSTQAGAGSFTWPAVTPASGWVRSNEYIELEVDEDSTRWGVQIYTDNTNSAASPQFVRPTGTTPGDPGTNPAGLVDASAPSVRIPLAWSVKAGTQTPTAAAPTSAEPNNSSDNNSFQWLYVKDLQTPNIASENTTAFQNGDLSPFVVIKNNVGIHYGQRDTDFGAENPPNYLYLEANFGMSLTGPTPPLFQTSRLIIEFFYD